jgi:hypothetical protein
MKACNGYNSFGKNLTSSHNRASPARRLGPQNSRTADIEFPEWWPGTQSQRGCGEKVCGGIRVVHDRIISESQTG